jgi:hypothetical protein
VATGWYSRTYAPPDFRPGLLWRSRNGCEGLPIPSSRRRRRAQAGCRSEDASERAQDRMSAASVRREGVGSPKPAAATGHGVTGPHVGTGGPELATTAHKKPWVGSAEPTQGHDDPGNNPQGCPHRPPWQSCCVGPTP